MGMPLLPPRRAPGLYAHPLTAAFAQAPVQVPVYRSNADSVKGANAVTRERVLCKGAPRHRPAPPVRRPALCTPRPLQAQRK